MMQINWQSEFVCIPWRQVNFMEIRVISLLVLLRNLMFISSKSDPPFNFKLKLNDEDLFLKML